MASWFTWTSSQLIVWDFNFHIDDDKNWHTRQFLDILESHNLKQWITESSLVNAWSCDYQNLMIHSLVAFQFLIQWSRTIQLLKSVCMFLTPQSEKKVIKYRKIHSSDFLWRYCKFFSGNETTKWSLYITFLVDQYENMLHYPYHFTVYLSLSILDKWRQCLNGVLDFDRVFVVLC